MAELIVKVDPAKARSPASHVRRIVRSLELKAPAPAPAIEEVFPGLRSGRSAGLVSVEIPEGWPSASQVSLLGALRGDAAIEYVQEPKRRRPS